MTDSQFWQWVRIEQIDHSAKSYRFQRDTAEPMPPGYDIHVSTVSGVCWREVVRRLRAFWWFSKESVFESQVDIPNWRLRYIVFRSQIKYVHWLSFTPGSIFRFCQLATLPTWPPSPIPRRQASARGILKVHMRGCRKNLLSGSYAYPIASDTWSECPKKRALCFGASLVDLRLILQISCMLLSVIRRDFSED
jgi:hypothetical protein